MADRPVTGTTGTFPFTTIETGPRFASGSVLLLRVPVSISDRSGFNCDLRHKGAESRVAAIHDRLLPLAVVTVCHET
jgi:hypothetical protein